MRLLVKWVNMRGGYTSAIAWQPRVVDEDTGKQVGYVHSQRSPAERHISLFGGKYEGDFESQKECVAFAKGVEAVLNHLTDATEQIQHSYEAA